MRFYWLRTEKFEMFDRANKYFIFVVICVYFFILFLDLCPQWRHWVVLASSVQIKLEL